MLTPEIILFRQLCIIFRRILFSNFLYHHLIDVCGGGGGGGGDGGSLRLVSSYIVK